MLLLLITIENQQLSDHSLNNPANFGSSNYRIPDFLNIFSSANIFLSKSPHMKKILLSLLCLTGAVNLFSQSTGHIGIPDPAQQGSISKIHRTSTNHYISCGTSGSGFSQHEIIYWDSNFDPVWNQYFASAAVLYWIDVIETNDGNFVAFGANQNNSGSNIAVKFTPAGTILWQKEYYISGNFLTSFCISKAAGNDPGFIFGGGACAASSFLVRCDASGNILWQHEYFITSSSGVQTTWSIIPENNAYVIGGNWLNGSQNDVYFTKVDSSGTWQFTNLVNEPTYNEIPVKMIKLTTGNYAMICQYNSNPNYYQCVYYFNSNGQVFQGTKFTGPGNVQIDINDIAETTGGQTILVGDINDSPMKYLFMELNASGAVTWQKKATGVTPGYLNGTCYNVAKTASGNYAIAGAAYTDGRTITVIDTTGAGFCNAVASTVTVTGPDTYTNTAFTPVIISPNVLAQTVSNTSSQLTLTNSTLCGTTGMEETAATEGMLLVFPNPASDELHISFGDKAVTNAPVIFYNVLGEKVLSETISASALDISSLTKGVYLVEVTTQEGKFVKRIVKE